jgi:hypothetical protein
LPQEIGQAFNEKLDLFLADMLHPSLRVKKNKRGSKSMGRLHHHEIPIYPPF